MSRTALFVAGLVIITAVAAYIPIELRRDSAKDPQYFDIANDVSNTMNWTINPCDDFYTFSCILPLYITAFRFFVFSFVLGVTYYATYSNTRRSFVEYFLNYMIGGGWLSSTEIPPEESIWYRSFSVIRQKNEAVLKSILIDPSVDTKLQGFYNSCMNLNAIEANGLDDLYPSLAAIEVIRGDPNRLMKIVGFLHLFGVNALFSPNVVIDAKNPTRNIFDIGQGGLALPDASYYFNNDDLIGQYTKHIATMFELVLQIEPQDALNAAQQVVEFETAIANITIPPDNLIDPFVVYNKYSYSQLQQLTPNLMWDSYLKDLDLTLDNVIIDAPAYLGNLSIVVGQNVKNWEVYLSWQLIHSMAPYGPKALVNENFNFFGKILSGQKQLTARDTFCVRATDPALGELLGTYFVKRAFPGESKTVASKMIQSIEDAMQKDLNALNWMDDQTRGQALTKLSLIINMIGYPENPRNYSSFHIEDSFMMTVMKYKAENFGRKLLKLNESADRYEWEKTAAAVDAYYDPTKNDMIFPAGILQSPFFNVSYPLAMNYGGVGMVMGHELTHGFDNQGKDYDGTGMLRNWWQPQTEEEFNRRAQCVIDQYSQFQPIPGVHVNGKLTQGENIADMGGIKNSFSAYTNVAGGQVNEPSIVNGLTNGQLFFVAFAQGWCQKITENYLKIQIKTDPHSPARFRVIGPLINLPEFSQTFNCPVGSFMNPTNRCTVW